MALEARILDASPANAGKWEQAVVSVPAPDVYFLPGYAAAYEQVESCRALCFIAWEADRLGINVFLARPVDDLPFAIESTGLWDAVTPYGYGGPVFNREALEDPGFVGRFFQAFADHCRREGIVDWFVRFHPLLWNHLPCEKYMEVIEGGPTVFLNLEGTPERIAAEFSSPCRRNLNKAMDAGLEIRPMSVDKELDAFVDLYHRTMERAGANATYFFPRSYFEAMRKGLGGKMILLGAFAGDRLACCAMFLLGGRIAHYHLGASNPDLLHLRPNNLLFYRSFLLAKENGASLFHLGGGYRGEDSLLRFKRGFSRSSSRFFMGRAVFLPKEYEKLTAMWRTYRGADHGGDQAYFPIYRSPEDAG